MRAWIVLFSLVMVASGAQAAPCRSDAETTHEIKIGSTVSIGTTPIGTELTRTFRLVNKDETRPMNITGFFLNPFHADTHPWLIKERPSDSIPPGGEDCLTVVLLGLKEGVYKADLSWHADTDPPSEEDTFFVFSVQGKVVPPSDEGTER